MKKSTASTEHQLRPKQRDKFRPTDAKDMVQALLKAKLEGQTYAEVQAVSREIADTIKVRLKELNKPRYKYIVQVVIIQQKGQGVQAGNRCFWDFDTDSCFTETYANDHLICLVTLYGVYLY